MASSNEWLASEAIRHALNLRFYGNWVVQRLIAVLNRADARLFADLTDALERLDAASFTVERLDSMLASVRAMNKEAFDQVGRELNEVLKAFTGYEVKYQHELLITAMPVQVSVATVSVEAVYSAALSRPFQGVLLREVWKDLGANRLRQVRQTIAQGFVEGKTTDAIIRELRGTKAKGFQDGLVNKSRRDVEAVVRTALGHHAGFVADRTTEANLDLIKAVRWESTLDGRTSEACRARDGKLYTPDTHKPMGHSLPWGQGPSRYHWGCRSHQSYVTKSWRELGIDIDEVPEGTRASATGQVPASTTYYEWLMKQPASVQDDVLGPTRGRLMRDGGLKADQLTDDKGKTLTLAQLRERDAEAFKRAGL